MAAASFLTAVIFVPETCGPIILSRRAKARRYETKNWALHAKIDEQQTNLSDILTRYLFRPLQMLIQEPILLLITLYMAFIYGIIYLFFEAYPITFQEERGWNLGVGALPFLALTIGVVFGAIFVSYLTMTRFARKMKKHGRVVPEERLPPMILGAVMLPIGLFWFAWTSSPHITWVPQVLAGIPIGMGVFMIFMQGINYIIDVSSHNPVNFVITTAISLISQLSHFARPLQSSRRLLGIQFKFSSFVVHQSSSLRPRH
jgi:DHA1 family multidrug resistance protein-like MFS transporter